jgi:hypothetical protein
VKGERGRFGILRQKLASSGTFGIAAAFPLPRGMASLPFPSWFICCTNSTVPCSVGGADRLREKCDSGRTGEERVKARAWERKGSAIILRGCSSARVPGLVIPSVVVT